MKIVVITGGNKGVGRGIVETLCKIHKDDWSVYLTARNENLGRKTLAEINEQGLNAKFHQLDINDDLSRKNLKEYLMKNYGGLDILVNNAGIAYKEDSTAPFSEQAEVTLKTNFYSTLKMCQEFLPIIKQDGRLVNVSSLMGSFALRKLNKELYEKFVSSMTIEELVNSMNIFIQAAKDGKVEERGWPKSAYGVSKLGCTKMAFILAEEMKNDSRKILINACCPGYVSTDMTNHKGTKTIKEGAVTPCFLVTLPVGTTEPYGKFISELEVSEWK